MNLEPERIIHGSPQRSAYRSPEQEGRDAADLEEQAKNTQQSTCSKRAQFSGGLPAHSWKCLLMCRKETLQKEKLRSG